MILSEKVRTFSGIMHKECGLSLCLDRNRDCARSEDASRAVLTRDEYESKEVRA